jgi:hypothetical protein
MYQHRVSLEKENMRNAAVRKRGASLPESQVTNDHIDMISKGLQVNLPDHEIVEVLESDFPYLKINWQQVIDQVRQNRNGGLCKAAACRFA